MSMIGGAEPDHSLLDGALKRVGLGRAALDVLAESATTAVAGDDRCDRLDERVAELERLASTDDLTGLANRRQWMSSARAAIDEGSQGAVLLCDVDHFKNVNDTFGHATGDAVLIEIARILQQYGAAGRLGGDEFVVWIPRHEVAHEIATRIVSEVEDTFASRARTIGEPAPSVGLSIGVAVVGRDLSVALDRADRALYSAKAAGRGRAASASDPAPLQVAADPIRLAS
jgi:diguanylate cyclase (GGDEF)-like protein